MKFPGAPYGLKIACGENPKRLYGKKGRSPATRMGNVAGYRKAWIDAADYVRRWDKWEAGAKAGDPPKRDLQLETLAGVLRGDILVQNHCYRADGEIGRASCRETCVSKCRSLRQPDHSKNTNTNSIHKTM